MSDCIEQSDQRTNNPAVASNSKRRGPARSSSASSSSSFDSCSDLLGSLEHAEENLDAQVLQAHEDFQDNESNSAVEDSVVCDQALQSGDVLPGVAHERMAEGQGFSSPTALEVKDYSLKVEGLSIKDHAYGLSNAISFSKVRSLAGNTVERISQFPTTFSLPLPTSYIFRTKNAVPVSNPPLLPDVETDAQTEVSSLSKEQPVEGKEVLDSNPSSEGFQGEAADPLPEKLSACNLVPVVETTDVSSRDPLETNSCSSANDALSVMGNNDTASIDTASDTIPGKVLGPESEPTKDAVSTIVGDSVPVMATMYMNTVDTLGNALGNNTPTTDPCFENSIGFAGVTEIIGKSDTDIPKHSDYSVLPQIARSLDIVLEDAPYPPDHTKQVSGEDSEVPQLENSVMSSDMHKENPVVCHPLRSLSSGSGRPDLEEFDDEQVSASGNKQFSDWNFGSRKAGMLANGHPFELFDNAPNPAKWPSSLDHVQVGNHFTSSGEPELQVENLPILDNLSEGRKVSVNDQPIPAEVLEELESSSRHNLFPPEQFCGDILQEDKLRGLSVWLDGNSQEREEKEDLGPDELFRYVENLELNEAYVDTVLDMEDVLLNHDEHSSRERFLLASSNSVIGTPRSSRDGSLSSSTSGLQLLTSGDHIPFTVDWIEVVGAKQRRGGSSFGERIVGVKDHTVYCIKVSSGSQEWEVFRRYRDFVDLYHQLRRKFNVRTERSLPGPWREVDKDSRKVFGSTHPNIIEIRSTRIEKCLQSLVQSGPPLSISTPLCWFLSPPSTFKSLFGREGNHLTSFSASQKGLDVQLGAIEPPSIQSPRSDVGSLKSELDHDRSSLPLGKTVKLNLKVHPNKNLKQLLSAQHHSCAGCYKHLDMDRGLVQGFVQTLGWGKPRLCEYSGQLYCTSCHSNEPAVLPAQVLWHWDFTPRRVSQLAKAYLDSIYDQPMLCVSAVNPYLYTRVPILFHVKETRKKLSRMLSCMLCPLRNRISQTMASRRYLLENNDFFALRDLEDLSKGAFAVLPGLLTAVMESLKLHITKQCSVCSETGDWCGAGVLCEEPFSPIYPFEEENITRCKICHTSFHEACFSSLISCPACPLNQSKRLGLPGEVEHSQVEKIPENGREVDVLSLLGVSQEVTASTPSAGDTALQGQSVTDEQSSSHNKWPSFYHLLPKKRLW